MLRLAIPERFRDDPSIVFVANMSGGKDSTALACALREAEIPHRRVFADTRWEAPETYAHLDVLREKLGPIDVVGYPGGMPAKIREGARFASRMQRWCTKELKIQPLRTYFDAVEANGAEAICTTGIRAEEGTEKNGRATMPEIEDDHVWGGWMWRPLLQWTVADVIEIHRRHGIPMNPLYHRGHDRVGCYPCVMASKADVRLVADHSPARIAEIRSLEEFVTAERGRRNGETPGRYKYENASFFLKAMNRSDPEGTMMTIDEVVAWSRTDRGGRQLPMFPPVPDGGCFRWGLCEAPERGDNDVGA
jgi:3'-phosphoadenosine 5'-phosphosulfate sulfotransferase (PAPS reductase)/FAD synthetase